MPRAHGRSSPAARSGGRRGRTPDEARLVGRLKRLAPQQKALLLALQPFSDSHGRFDRERWRSAFADPDPEAVLKVAAVTGLFNQLVNHLIEMLQVAARLRGLDISRGEEKPSTPGLLAAVRGDGGLTANQESVLKRLQGMRNELQHASPGVEADEVYDDILLLARTLKRFAQSHLAWLSSHDIALLE